MQKSKTNLRRQLLFSLILLLIAGSFFTSCKNHSESTSVTTVDSTSTHRDSATTRMDTSTMPLTATINAVIRDNWNGQNSTEIGDSLWYSSNGNAYSAKTDVNGAASVTDDKYTAGQAIVMEATANGEICGKVYNQALTSIIGDGNLVNPTFTITALGTNIPVKITVTDMSGNPRSGYTVQFKQSGNNYGSAATTNSSGVVTYGTNLLANTVYTAVASGAAGSSSPVTVSTIPLTGSGGSGATGKSYSGVAVYIRY